MAILTAIYISAAAIGFVLGLFHLIVWLRNRTDLTFLFAASMSLGASMVAVLELSMAQASTAESYLAALTLTVYPVCAIVVPMVWFTYLRLGMGLKWLAVLISVIWIAGVLIELVTPGPVMVTSAEISQGITPWGEPFAVGILTTPWFKLLLDLPTPLIVYFAADASVRTYRQGRKRDAVVFGGSVFFFILVAGVHAVLIDFGFVHTPYMISIWFLAIVVALGLGVADDVARSTDLLRRLEQQNRRWRMLLGGIQLASVRADRDGRVAYVNPFMEQLVGRPASDLLGSDVFDLVFSGEEKFEPSVLPQRIKTTISGSGGGRRDVVWFNVKLLDGAGNHDGFISFGEDVTDTIRTRNELVQTRKELERMSRALTLGEMAATLAHELSQPVAAILSNVQAANMIRKGQGVPTDELDEILDDILRDSRRATGIIRRVRSYVFNEPTMTEWFDIGDAISEIIEIFANDAETKEIDITLNGPATPLQIRASRIELQQVIANLVLNSFQAMAGEQPRTKQLGISWRQQDGQAVICVDDSGPGLPDTAVVNIFEPFSTTKIQGTGIGLAVARRVIERHKGAIQTGHSPLGGARFQVTLPIPIRTLHVAAR